MNYPKCELCGADINHVKHSRQKYCSAECSVVARRMHQNQRLQEQKEHNLELPKEKHKCADCGKPTPNRRCDKCRRIWQAKHGVSTMVDSSHHDY